MTLRIELEASCLQLCFLLEDAGSLQEVIKRELLLKILLLDVERVFQGFCLQTACHVFAKESLNIFLLSVAIHAAAWCADCLASVVEMGNI